MNARPSTSYYPPRARWYRLFPETTWRLKIWLQGKAPEDGWERRTLKMILGFIVPGLSFFMNGRGMAGLGILLVYLEGIVCFFAFLGQPAGKFSLLVLMTLHAVSACFMMKFSIIAWTFREKLLAYLGVILMLFVGFYVPAVNWLLASHMMPLNVRGKVYVIRPDQSVSSVRAGDFVAYRTTAADWGTGTYTRVQMRAGYGFDRVLAMEGDQVVFTPKDLQINGQIFPRVANMPESGEFVVPKDHWFIWPTGVAVPGTKYLSKGAYIELIRNISLVPESRYIGKPYERWFWREQVAPAMT